MRKFITALIVSVAIATVTSAVGEAGDSTPISEAESTTALERLLPLPERHSTIALRHFQSGGSHTTLEFSISLTYDGDSGKVHAILREVVDESLFMQLSQLRVQHPEESLDQLTRRVEVRDLKVGEEKCKGVREAYQAFARTRFRPPGIDRLVLHPFVYEFTVQGAEDMHLTTFEFTHPLARWAESFRKTIGRCDGSAV